MRLTSLAIALSIGVLAHIPAASAEGLDAVFAGRAPGETASFFLVLRTQADLSGADAIASPAERRRFVYEALRETAEATQADLRAELSRDGVSFRPFYLVNMIEVEAHRPVAEALAARPDVALVAANRPSRLSRPETLAPDPRPLEASVVEASLDVVRAPAVWAQGITGQGIVVGIADTGVAWEHPALKNRYRGFDGGVANHAYNWHDSIHAPVVGNPCGADSPFPCDDHSHGTHVTGTVLGTDGGENQIGVAPGARWIGCRNMDSNVGTPARYTECFQFFLAPTDANGANPRPEIGADIVSNSWGCPPSEGCTDPNVLRAVVENTRAAGIFVAVSAGNEGSGGCSTVATAPGFYDASFSVGATTLADTIASFSSRGPVTIDGSNRLKPDLVAPGVSVRSSVPPAAYARFSGTSMAAPHVSGAVALVWSAVPSLAGRVSETEALLRATAVPLFSDQTCGGFPGSAVPNAVFGWGRLDVAAAVAAMGGPQTPPAAPRIPVNRGRNGARTVSPRL